MAKITKLNVAALAGMASDFSGRELRSEFGANFHVRYPSVFNQQKNNLVLVKGGPGSRLFSWAHRISAEGKNRNGKPLKVLSPEMRQVFGDFGGRNSIQRSPPRWVAPEYVDTARSPCSVDGIQTANRSGSLRYISIVG